jgi:hypothetical protein
VMGNCDTWPNEAPSLSNCHLIFNVGLVYKSNAGINTWHQHWQQGPLAMMQYQPDQFYSCNLVANLSWGPEVIFWLVFYQSQWHLYTCLIPTKIQYWAPIPILFFGGVKFVRVGGLAIVH